MHIHMCAWNINKYFSLLDEMVWVLYADPILGRTYRQSLNLICFYHLHFWFCDRHCRQRTCTAEYKPPQRSPQQPVLCYPTNWSLVSFLFIHSSVFSNFFIEFLESILGQGIRKIIIILYLCIIFLPFIIHTTVVVQFKIIK